jgi:hypothetical protein
LKGEAVNKLCAVKSFLFVVLCMTIGCATTEVSNRQTDVTGKIPRPDRIWVYDFAATPADIPADSALAGKVTTSGVSQKPEHIAEGRKLGAEIEKELVAKINAMGMQAEHAVQGTSPRINDIVIKGYLVSFNEGDEAARVGVGFGSGNTDLKVAVEGFQMTDKGLRKLGSGTTDAEGNKTPGAAMGGAMFLVTHNPVGLIVSTGMKVYGEESGSSKVEGRAKQTAQEIADILKKKFQEQGWISPVDR